MVVPAFMLMLGFEDYFPLKFRHLKLLNKMISLRLDFKRLEVNQIKLNGKTKVEAVSTT